MRTQKDMYICIVLLEIRLESGSSKIFLKFYSFAFKLFALSMHLGVKIQFLFDIWISLLDWLQKNAWTLNINSY